MSRFFAWASQMGNTTLLTCFLLAAMIGICVWIGMQFEPNERPSRIKTTNRDEGNVRFPKSVTFAAVYGQQLLFGPVGVNSGESRILLQIKTESGWVGVDEVLPGEQWRLAIDSE